MENKKSDILVGNIISGGTKWYGGGLDPNGKIYGTPVNANTTVMGEKADILILHEELKSRIEYLESLPLTDELIGQKREVNLLMIRVQQYAISHLTKNKI